MGQAVLKNLSKNLEKKTAVWPCGQTVSYSLSEVLSRIPKTPRQKIGPLLEKLQATPAEVCRGSYGVLHRFTTKYSEGNHSLGIIMLEKNAVCNIRPIAVTHKTVVEFYQSQEEKHWMPSIPKKKEILEEYEAFSIVLEQFESLQIPEWVAIRSCFVSHGCRKDQYDAYIAGEGTQPEVVKRGVILASKAQNAEGFFRATNYYEALTLLTRALPYTLPNSHPASEKLALARFTLYEYLRVKSYLQRIKETETSK